MHLTQHWELEGLLEIDVVGLEVHFPILWSVASKYPAVVEKQAVEYDERFRHKGTATRWLLSTTTTTPGVPTRGVLPFIPPVASLQLNCDC